MSDWLLFLAPLLVLPIVLLFRFVGCGKHLPLSESPAPAQQQPTPQQPTPQQPTPPPDTEKPEPPPVYRDTILASPQVIAYWRLVDDPKNPGQFAADEMKFKDGEVKEGHALPNVNPTPTTAGSEPRNPANFTLGQNSLIDSDPQVQCRYFDGGYVFVPHEPGLFSNEFTIEAWVKLDSLALNYEHVLFDAGGTYAYPAGSTAAQRGFRIYADRANSWQVRVAPFPDVLFAAPPLIALNARTHIAVTVADKTSGSAEKTVTLYLDGKTAGTRDIPSYNPPHEAPLFIGVDNTRPAPTASSLLRHPALFRIQEVVLYRKALPAAEIKTHVEINKKAVP